MEPREITERDLFLAALFAGDNHHKCAYGSTGKCACGRPRPTAKETVIAAKSTDGERLRFEV